LLSEKKKQSAQPFSFPMKTRFVEISKSLLMWYSPCCHRCYLLFSDNFFDFSLIFE